MFWLILWKKKHWKNKNDITLTRILMKNTGEKKRRNQLLPNKLLKTFYSYFLCKNQKWYLNVLSTLLSQNYIFIRCSISSTPKSLLLTIIIMCWKFVLIHSILYFIFETSIEKEFCFWYWMVKRIDLFFRSISLMIRNFSPPVTSLLTNSLVERSKSVAVRRSQYR